MIQAVEEPDSRVALLSDGRAQPVEKRIAAGEPVQSALVSQVAVIHDGLGAVLGHDVGPAFLDFREGLVVGDLLKLPAALGSHALHCIQEPVGVVVMLGVVLELHA